jgi:hypothetical protein
MRRGITISRRPKRRKSSENRPGPSSVNAIPRMIRIPAEKGACRRAEDGIDGNARARQLVPITIADAEYDVNSPSKTKAPAVASAIPTAIDAKSAPALKQFKPSASPTNPSPNLRSTSAIPERPPGKAENSCRSVKLLAAPSSEQATSDYREPGSEEIPASVIFA